jgi:N-acetylglucosamine kinase-like BadF-type ATPase
MGLLIAEVGASSSRWAWLTGADAVPMLPWAGGRLAGFNPVNGDASGFARDIQAGFAAHLPDALHAGRIVVYGAGCGSDARRAAMAQAVRSVWPGASIAVHSDLLGAARGLCGARSGLVLILGTGMNSGWFDGERLQRPLPSLGFILGDEGSGADIGRTLLQDAFYHRMPEPIRSSLFGDAGPVLDEVIEAVYRSPFPARSLAAPTARLVPLLQESYVRELITGRFQLLMELVKEHYPADQRRRVYATGSVAWGFSELLASCLLEHGMELTAVERDPLAGLVQWHRSPPA